MTGIRAALAGISAETHLLAVGEAIAGRLTLLAHLRAHGAGVGMQIGSAKHEVGAGLADFRAVHQQADDGAFAHLAALREAVADGEHADALAVAAVLDALLHVKGCGLGKTHWTSMAVW